MPDLKIHREFEPPEALRDTVRCFWYDRSALDAQQASFEVAPDGYAEIIFYSGTLGYKAADGNRLPLSSPFIIGLLNKPVLFYTQHCLEIIAVRCYPWTVFDLLGLPPGKDTVRLFQHPMAGLQPELEQYIRAGEIEKAVHRVQEYFLALRASVSIDTMLFKAGAAMSAAAGALPVSRVAAAAHATVRTLERKFKQSSGYTVKDVSGLMRFEQARNRLWHHPGTNLAGLAAELGYTDQAHMSRVFKRYAGVTPAVFARNAKKRQQTVHYDFVAFVQA